MTTGFRTSKPIRQNLRGGNNNNGGTGFAPSPRRQAAKPPPGGSRPVLNASDPPGTAARRELVDAITRAPGCGWSRPELEAMTTGALRKLAALAATGDGFSRPRSMRDALRRAAR